MQLLVCFALVSALLTVAFAQTEPFLNGTFPDGFLWGAATSSYQIEGGWNADGKGENIWDRFCHEGGNIANGDTGDVACDSYNLYQDDIQLAKNLGVHFYRFSLSWSRILPQGTGPVNEAGVAYYINLLQGLIAAGIEPAVTLYHWDLPQPLQDNGGWQSPDIVQHFNEYARVCFQRFGHLVKIWITLNEPWVVSYLGYGVGSFAPGIYSPDVGTYEASHNLIKSHAAAWHTYDTEFRPIQNGMISVTLDSDWKEPYSADPVDIDAAERAMQFKLGWFANAIYVNGDYPEIMKTKVAEKSQQEGLSESRLPEFTEEEKQFNLGTHDFFGLNHYTTQLVKQYDRGTTWPSWDFDRDVEETTDDSWPTSGSDWLRVVPWGMRKLLVWIKDHYGNPPVLITENGYSDIIALHQTRSVLNDQPRIDYYTGYINNVLQAIELDECNVIGYTAWSLMDNFEWASGYTQTFGLHQVDFTDPLLTRVPKDSATWYQQLIVDNGWPTTSRRQEGNN